ncbi:hypothetical protein R6V09_13395 [Streptomyces sp. W16]|uniref:hypothetical protein n=1 Tax=Streptomyces sp. W16 TaxID=3076631 RepID=UPI00295C0DA9|nr:hypothetical protein [Streptomyces sp. W16]MDV9171118.1 hypothetical protein [Streptomyces sp. W16]
MVYLAITALALVSVVAAAVTVLVRRDRRRMAAGPEARRIEAAATRDFRDARSQAHGYEHFSDASGGISALRDRDSR